jgi:hypothetical protein
MEIRVKWIAKLAIVYAVASLLWSTVGFLTAQRLPYEAEYSGQFLVTEVGGHVLFGLAAGAMTRKPSLALLTAAEAALIDADHLLSIFVAPVLDRTAHSFFFLAAACLLLGYVARNGNRLNYPVMGATLAAFFAHLSYDTFLSNGKFPLFTPLDFAVYTLPGYSWVLFETAAVAVGLVVGALAKRENGRSLFARPRHAEEAQTQNEGRNA